MAGKVVNLSFVLSSKFGVSRQENASKTATSHISKTFQMFKPYPSVLCSGQIQTPIYSFQYF
jgi:hypothetical protein